MAGRRFVTNRSNTIGASESNSFRRDPERIHAWSPTVGANRPAENPRRHRCATVHVRSRSVMPKPGRRTRQSRCGRRIRGRTRTMHRLTSCCGLSPRTLHGVDVSPETGQSDDLPKGAWLRTSGKLDPVDRDVTRAGRMQDAAHQRDRGDGNGWRGHRPRPRFEIGNRREAQERQVRQEAFRGLAARVRGKAMDQAPFQFNERRRAVGFHGNQARWTALRQCAQAAGLKLERLEPGRGSADALDDIVQGADGHITDELHREVHLRFGRVSSIRQRHRVQQVEPRARCVDRRNDRDEESLIGVRSSHRHGARPHGSGAVLRHADAGASTVCCPGPG